MFCPKCGIQVSDNAKFCPKCGYGFSSVGAVPTGSVAMPHADTVSSAAPVSTAFERKLAQAASEGLGMNWYKFIIYVQCFLGGFSGLVTGVRQLFGVQYGVHAEYFYKFYTGLKVVDVIYGIVCIAVGLLLILTRFGLKEFKASAVGVYLFLQFISTVSALLYLLIDSFILKVSPFNSTFIASGTIGLIIGSVGLFVANYIYFGRRKHLFNE